MGGQGSDPLTASIHHNYDRSDGEVRKGFRITWVFRRRYRVVRATAGEVCVGFVGPTLPLLEGPDAEVEVVDAEDQRGPALVVGRSSERAGGGPELLSGAQHRQGVRASGAGGGPVVAVVGGR